LQVPEKKYLLFSVLAYICASVNTLIRQSSIVYLACIILLRMMAMPLSLLDYSINRDFIATHLCENKSKPELHCAGTCFLHKQLNRASESPESRDSKGSTRIQVIDFFEPTVLSSFGCSREAAEFGTGFLQEQLTHPFPGNIFHPPIA
jgi:hypothetical protein